MFPKSLVSFKTYPRLTDSGNSLQQQVLNDGRGLLSFCPSVLRDSLRRGPVADSRVM